jgi:hypothetical protein
MSLDTLAAQMNVTDAEIETWAHKKYPQFIANKTLIKRLFLIEKGIRFSAPFQPKELRSINQLVVGETADIQAVVVQELSTRSYIGCPNDSKKIPEAIEGKEAVCPKCGQIVKPKSLQWALFLVGDATDEIIASFPPSIMNRPSEGMIIVAQGLLGENEEFLVYRWTLPSDTKPGASSSETPLQSFFKPTTPSTTSSLPVTTPPTTTPQVTTPTTSATTHPTTPTTTPLSSTTPPTTGALMCDQCSAGPFVNQLALTGHKVTAHAKKTVKRLKKPGVTGYTPVASQPVASQTTAPTTPTVTPTTVTTTDSRETTAKLEVTATDKPNQSTPGAVIEPDSRLISLVAGADQAVIPEQKVVPGEQTVVSPEQAVVQADQRVVQPTQGASNSVISASQSQSPTASVVQPPVTTVPGTLKEELKAVDGASLASVKYTKLSGLIAKSLQDFKLQFEASFPKDDMVKALEASHCSIVDGKVVFTGA